MKSFGKFICRIVAIILHLVLLFFGGVINVFASFALHIFAGLAGGKFTDALEAYNIWNIQLLKTFDSLLKAFAGVFDD